jgi:SNF2 family DNA or RNA helicase
MPNWTVSCIRLTQLWRRKRKSKKDIEALHKILRPFLLRRVKSDIEINLLPSTWFYYYWCDSPWD